MALSSKSLLARFALVSSLALFGASSAVGCEATDNGGSGPSLGSSSGSIADGGPSADGASASSDSSTVDGAADGDVPTDALAPRARPAGASVLLYTGAGGGGPATDLFVSQVSASYTNAKVDVTTSDTVPADFASRYAVMVLLNPLQGLDSATIAAAKGLVTRGGRVVLVMEHCKDGCYGDAAAVNAVLGAVGSAIVMKGTGGAPLAKIHLVVASTPVTSGITDLEVYYTGSVTGGIAVGSVAGGDVVIAYDRIGDGDVVAIADTSMLGYVLADAQNTAFVAGLAKIR